MRSFLGGFQNVATLLIESDTDTKSNPSTLSPTTLFHPPLWGANPEFVLMPLEGCTIVWVAYSVSTGSERKES